MLVSHCDICKKEIEKEEVILIGTRHYFNCKEFCGDCASPVAEFLEKHKFIEEDKKAVRVKGIKKI